MAYPGTSQNSSLVQSLLAQQGLMHLRKENETEEERRRREEEEKRGNQPPPAPQPTKQPNPIGKIIGPMANIMLINKGINALKGSQGPENTPTQPGTSTPPPTASSPGPFANGGAASSSPSPDLGYDETPRPPSGPTVEAGATQPKPEVGFFDQYGNYIQGAAGAAQLWGGYNQWKEGDKVGGGLNMAGGAANVGAAAGSESAGTAASYLNYINAGYKGYKALNDDNMTGKEKAVAVNKIAGETMANYWTGGGFGLAKAAFPEVFAKIEGKVDPALMKYDPVTKVLGGWLGGKDRDQMNRDRMREALQDLQFLDENYNVKLANGGTFDMGQDGSKKIYNPDPENPATPEAVADSHLLAAIIAGKDPKMKEDMMGMLASAAISSGNPESNMLQMYHSAGITDGNTAREIIGAMQESEVITKEEGDQMQQNVAKLFGRPGTEVNKKSGGGKSSGSSKKTDKKPKRTGGSSPKRPPLFAPKEQVDRKPGSSATFSMGDYINSINNVRSR